MWVYVALFIIGGFCFLALQRILFRVLYWVGMSLSVVLGWRIIELLDSGFTVVYAKPIFVGAISALVVCVLCSSYIRHTLIYFYLQRNIQRDKDAAAAGKLW